MGRRRTGGGKSARKKGREIHGKREKRGRGSVQSCHASDNFFPHAEIKSDNRHSIKK